MERFRRGQWVEMRKMGRTRFIWMERIVRMGLPIALAVVTYQFIDLSLGFSDLLRPRGILTVVIGAVAGIASGFIYGVVEWDSREAAYREEDKS